MTDEEFNRFYLMDPQECSATNTEVKHPKLQGLQWDEKLPKTWDWRDFKIVSPVKAQQSCGSCWTFSTTGTFESHYAIATGKKGSEVVLFSEKQLLDCADKYDNHGCSGGLPSHAFQYIYDNGYMLGEDYPYQPVAETCKYDKSKIKAATFGSYNITAYDEHEMAAVIAKIGPVALSYKVVTGFRDYKSGVYTNTDCGKGPMDVNHAVQAVGYGTENGVAMWIVKNSWGADWGDQGYFKIRRNTNECALAVCNSYPAGVHPWKF